MMQFKMVLDMISKNKTTRYTDLAYFTTQVADTSDSSGIRVKNFDFDSDTSENTFSRLFISCMANERSQGEEQSHCKNYFFEMPRSHAKMGLKSLSQKMNFAMVKAISKSYTLDCSCKCP